MNTEQKQRKMKRRWLENGVCQLTWRFRIYHSSMSNGAALEVCVITCIDSRKWWYCNHFKLHVFIVHCVYIPRDQIHLDPDCKSPDVLSGPKLQKLHWNKFPDWLQSRQITAFLELWNFARQSYKAQLQFEIKTTSICFCFLKNWGLTHAQTRQRKITLVMEVTKFHHEISVL